MMEIDEKSTSKDDVFKAINPVKHLRDHLELNARPDGREFLEFRPTVINIDCIKTADGSAIVKVGSTAVICGVKAELSEPDNTDPDKGFIVPNIEVSKLCSSKYRAMGVSTESQILSQTLFNIISNSGCVKLEDLCIAKGKLVWTLYCDLICLNDGGSVLDVAVIALITALKSLKLPKVTYDSETQIKTIDIAIKNSLKINCTPITSTFMTFEEKYLLVDPTSDEEELSEKLITISISDGELCYVHQPGGGSMEPNQFETVIKNAKNREKYIKSLLQNICE